MICFAGFLKEEFVPFDNVPDCGNRYGRDAFLQAKPVYKYLEFVFTQTKMLPSLLFDKLNDLGFGCRPSGPIRAGNNFPVHSKSLLGDGFAMGIIKTNHFHTFLGNFTRVKLP